MNPQTTVGSQPSGQQKILLAAGMIGPLLFILVFLIAGAIRPDYNPLRQPVSSLSIGPSGWIQKASFIITGSLIFAFAIGLQRLLKGPGGSFWGPLLIALVGLGLFGAGLFVADPMNGYPPGTPLVPGVRTTHGQLHDLFGVPVFLGLPIGCLVFGRYFWKRGQRAWTAYSLISGLFMFATFVLAGMGFSQVGGLAGVAGVFQRLSIGSGWIWIALLAFQFWRKLPG